jgi:hypothetical protein
LEKYLDEETERHVAVRASPDARDAAAAFLAKRPASVTPNERGER